MSAHTKKIGLALGSGSARGMAHIGVIERLSELGLEPDIIVGTSVGAIIGACHQRGGLSHFREWIAGLTNSDVIRYMDVNLLGSGGGLANGTKLMEFMIDSYGNPDIEEMEKPFAAVATDLYSGREIWLQTGPLWNAVRASMALPGMLTPVSHADRWLVDGGLVNPVPISVCRALGADLIIGVNLNADLLRSAAAGKYKKPQRDAVPVRVDRAIEEEIKEDEDQFSSLARFTASIKDAAANLWSSGSDGDKKSQPPGTLNVMMNTINIMQDRITRSRLAGEPADIMLSPRLGNFGLMEFDRTEEAIEEGRRAVNRMIPTLRHMLELESGFPELTDKPVTDKH